MAVESLGLVAARKTGIDAANLISNFSQLPGNIVVEDILAWRQGTDGLCEVCTNF
jgi:hypothetical protein